MIKYISCILGLTDLFRDVILRLMLKSRELKREVTILTTSSLLVLQFSIIWGMYFFHQTQNQTEIWFLLLKPLIKV